MDSMALASMPGGKPPLPKPAKLKAPRPGNKAALGALGALLDAVEDVLPSPYMLSVL